MNCKHPYYRLENGQLICCQCGEPPTNKKSDIEDKIDHKVEIKSKQELIREQTKTRVKRYRNKHKPLQ